MPVVLTRAGERPNAKSTVLHGLFDPAQPSIEQRRGEVQRVEEVYRLDEVTSDAVRTQSIAGSSHSERGWKNVP